MQTPTPPPIPRTFMEYLRSFGPGIMIVLTWLGAGDVVDMGIAGSNYGYSLMWVLVLAIFMRFIFVSLIARYQLCNQHGEGVLDGLARLHRGFALILLIASILMAHVYGAYMSAGIGEVCHHVAGWGPTWFWALACNAVALWLVFNPRYERLEWAFKIFLAMLSISFIGCAVWVGFKPLELVEGLYRLDMPDQQGRFDPMLVAVAMIGAVGGSIMNLAYPYFLDAKGWRGPEYRKVQFYDFLLAAIAMILLNLAVWILGAELLYPDRHISRLDDLPKLLSITLGKGGEILFYLGIFAAIYTSIIGHAMGLGCLGTHSWLRWKAGNRPISTDFARHKLYRFIAAWCLVSPLFWTFPGMPDFVSLTLLANSAHVILLPLLAGGLWWITASEKFIGKTHRNRWWENIVMALLFALAIYGARKSISSIAEFFNPPPPPAANMTQL